MTSTFPQDDATNRDEMQCPECFTTGLEPLPSSANQYDSRKEQLVYGTRCPNDDCDVDRVPPEGIYTQLRTGVTGFGSASTLVRNPGVQTISVILALGLLIGAAVIAGGALNLDLGGKGAATTNNQGDYSNLNQLPPGNFTTYNASGNWTIYNYGDEFVVTGEVNGTVVFLGPAGNTSTTPYFFNSLDDARESILAWKSTHRDNPGPESPNRTELYQRSNWSIYEYNESFVVGGKIDGEVVYLYPNASYRDTPHLYSNRSAAIQALIYWESLRDQYPEKYPSLSPSSEEEVRNDLVEWERNSGTRTESGENSDESLTSRNTSSSSSSRSVSGAVYNSQGEPVEGATVHLHSRPRTKVTGENGTYRFENVPSGTHTIYVEPPNGSELASTKAVKFTLSSDGIMRLNRSPENIVFYRTDSGAVAQNELQLLMQPAQPIRFTGIGSNISATVNFSQPANAAGTVVRLTGVYKPQKQVQTVPQDETIHIRGNVPPTNERLLLRGVTTTRNESISGNYTGKDPVVEIAGNKRPRNVRLTLQGKHDTTRRSTNGTLVWDKYEYQGATEYQRVFGDDSQRKIRTQDVYTAPTTGEYRIRIPWSLSLNQYESGAVELQICGSGGCREIEQVSRTPTTESYWGPHNYDGTFKKTVHLQEGDTVSVTLIADGYGEASVNTNEDAVEHTSLNPKQGVQITTNNSLQPRNATVHISVPNKPLKSYSIRRVHKGGDTTLFGGKERNTGKVPLFTAPEQGEYRVQIPYKMSAVSVHALRDIYYHGVSEMWIKTSTGNQLYHDTLSAWECDKRNCDKQQSGTITKTVSLEEGETIYMRYDVLGSATATIEETDSGVERVARAPGRVTITVDGETYTTKELGKGDSAAVHVGNISRDATVRISSSSSAGTVRSLHYRIEWTKVQATKSPSVKLGGEVVCARTGRLKGNITCDVPASKLEPGANRLNLGTESGTFAYTLNYTARAAPENATVTINSRQYQYPEDFEESGVLGTSRSDTARINISSLTSGENHIQLNSDRVDGIRTNVTANVVYTGGAKRTAQPRVVVRNSNGQVHSKPVPQSSLQNGKLYGNYPMQLPASWFSKGHNTVIVRTANHSQVRVLVRSSGLQYQTGKLKQVGNQTVQRSVGEQPLIKP